MLVALLISIIVILLTLWVGGIIGSPRQKDFFRRILSWSWKDSPGNLFIRIDPNKPLPEAWKEMADNAWPTKERLQKWLLWNLFWVGMIVLVGIMAVLFARN
jgi:hypothetical protein